MKPKYLEPFRNLWGITRSPRICLSVKIGNRVGISWLIPVICLCSSVILCSDEIDWKGWKIHINTLDCPGTWLWLSIGCYTPCLTRVQNKTKIDKFLQPCPLGDGALIQCCFQVWSTSHSFKENTAFPQRTYCNICELVCSKLKESRSYKSYKGCCARFLNGYGENNICILSTLPDLSLSLPLSLYSPSTIHSIITERC